MKYQKSFLCDMCISSLFVICYCFISINQSINKVCNAHSGRRIESNLRRGQSPGGWRPASKGPKFGRAKRTSIFRRDFWQLTNLIVNISRMDQHIEHLRETWSTPSTLGEKHGWTLVHKQKSSIGSYWPTHVDIFLETTFRPLGGAAPWNFYTRYRLTKAT